MTGAVLDRPVPLCDAPGAEGRAGAGGEPPPARRRVTLEERLNAVLHGVRTNGSIECPVCDARMTPAADGAACTSCGSRLS
jgi:hypothetical protein